MTCRLLIFFHAIDAATIILVIESPLFSKLHGALEAFLFLEIPRQEPIATNLNADPINYIRRFMWAYCQGGGECIPPVLYHKCVGSGEPDSEADFTSSTTLRLIRQRFGLFKPFVRCIGGFYQGKIEFSSYPLSNFQPFIIFL